MIHIDQTILNNLREGSFDENLFENIGMDIVDADIDIGDEADDSLMSESSMFDTIDSMILE